ncbi:hypothetical protein KM92DES2_12544 [uncultured Desulfovibrio sp.]|uniref:Uncharacterized protein n=1 Tax=uncultured Desulfovibrio sp. TaxID=167968 RepID=A0A212KAP1_9BACT|nr:hypothetical protein KM92DES2_12544 [uncultured Desulfovibrio sp.]
MARSAAKSGVQALRPEPCAAMLQEGRRHLPVWVPAAKVTVNYVPVLPVSLGAFCEYYLPALRFQP